MGKLVFTFTSLAQRVHEGVPCIEGMRLLADTLHPHGVPISWIVGPESAQLTAKELTQWHEEFGDDVIIGNPAVGGTLEEQIERLGYARDGVCEALPWATPTLAGGEHTDPQIVKVLEELGFEGIWGLCWEQIAIDNITDRGCPWGMYYMDRDQRLKPAEGRGPIGLEWTSRDLLKGFHSGNPTLYSTDPNDVARGGLCSWEDIAYWEGVADNYIRNTRYNDHVWLLQHQEAHEMESNEHFRCYTDEDAREAAIMLDRFVGYLKSNAPVEMMTLSDAAKLYRETYEATPSSYMFWEDIPTPPRTPDYCLSLPVGPWPRTFFFCDKDVQMMFIDGKVEPICIRNYQRDWDSEDYFAESRIPQVQFIRNTRFQWRREIELKVTSPCDMPYGIALWDNFAFYQVGEAPGLKEWKILSLDLLFLRYDLKQGENHFVINLEGK